MTPDEITDEDSLKAWLEGQTREVAVTISHRAAMRIAPEVWLRSRPVEMEKSETAIPSLRGLLISQLASQRVQMEIKRIAEAALGPFRFSPFDISSERVAHHVNAVCRASTLCVFGPLPDARTAFLTAHYEATKFLTTGFAKKSLSKRRTISVNRLFPQIRCDAKAFAADMNTTTAVQSPLWHNGDNRFAHVWQKVRRAWAATGDPGWKFWIDWYEAALDGRPLLGDWDRHWNLLTEIALIDPNKWDAGPDTVNPLIAEVVRAHKAKAAAPLAEIFSATLYDFRFDQIEGVMRAVPLEEDWKHLEDPERLASFLSDAQDFLSSADLLAAALDAEGTSMQGAGAIRVYLDAICAELLKAEAADLLRVDKLMEIGRLLDGMAARQDVRNEFGPLHVPLTDCIEKLRDLVRNHFSQTLARMTPLRDVSMEEDADPWRVLRDFREVVAGVRSGANGALPPLVREDAAILDDILDSVDTRLRELDAANADDTQSSLKREIDFQLAKVGATTGYYRERAMKAWGKTGDAIDEGMKMERRVVGLAKWGERLRHLFENPPA